MDEGGGERRVKRKVSWVGCFYDYLVGEKLVGVDGVGKVVGGKKKKEVEGMMGV